MATTKISLSGSIDLAQVFIDETLILSGTGKGTSEVSVGKDHALMWFVRGQPGSNYDVQITDPKVVAFEHKATIDSSTKDAGIHWFKVPAGGGK